MLTVKNPKTGEVVDQFLITLPKLRIDGMRYGSPYIELTETSWVASRKGFISVVSVFVSVSIPISIFVLFCFIFLVERVTDE